MGYEGERAFRTDGRANKHPLQEANAAEAHVVERLVSRRIYDEALMLRYAATNEEPFPFAWHNAQATNQAYAAALIRLSEVIQRRFRDLATPPA